MDTLPAAFSNGWASGINSYLVVLVLGLTDRVASVDSIPDVLARWDVLGVALALFSFEFVADKIPYVDSTWDAISTLIRPTVGAVIGVLLAGDADSLDQAVSGVVGGGSALAAHLTKAGTRLAINASPEPISNVVASLGEDVTVLAVVGFAIASPRAAAAVAAVLLAGGLVVLYLALRLVRRGWRRWRARSGPPAPPSGPPGPSGHPGPPAAAAL